MPVARELMAAGRLPDRSAWVARAQEKKATLQPETRCVSAIGLSQIAGAPLLHVFRVPVVVEVIVERVTNISMSTTNDISHVVEFEELATEPAHAPTPTRTLTS